MQKNNLEEWWMHTGSRELNKILIDWVGMNTGYVPLSNLTSEFCELSQKEQEELIPLMTADGAALRVTERQSGERTVLIWVK